MNLQDIMTRLNEEGYTNCLFSGTKQILLPGLGEIELAYGEAKIFDSKHPWPGYGGHECHKSLEALFEDIHETWPKEQPCEPSSTESDSSSDQSPPAEETATKDGAPARVTLEEEADDHD